MRKASHVKQQLKEVALSRRAAFTVPNLLTLLRVMLVPCFLYLLIEWLYAGDLNAHLLAVACFVIIAFSDMLDGYLARRWGQTSALGSLLDPAADFLFVMVSFVVLGVFDQLPMLLVIIVASKCVLLSLGWMLRYVTLSIVHVRPSLLGKWSTFMQFGCVGLALLETATWLKMTFWMVTGLLNVITVGDYLLHGLSQATGEQEQPDSNHNVVELPKPPESRHKTPR